MKYTILRAPQRDRETLFIPDLPLLGSTVRINVDLLRKAPVIVAGRTLHDFRRQARAEILARARDFTRSLAPDSPAPDPDAPLVFTGHQPEFVHPGVWIKNHLAQTLARSLGSIAVNLVLDSDIPRHLGLSIPLHTGDAARLVSHAFTEVLPGRTWEEHRPDASWDVPGFLAAVRESLPVHSDDILFHPFARTLESTEVTAHNAGSLITAGRIAVERDAGLDNLELRTTDLCSTHVFRLFLLAVLIDLERFRQAHNASLGLYREVHRLRGGANPLPDLAPDESPFWVYGPDEPRQPLLARVEGGSLALLHDDQPFFTLTPKDLETLRTGDPAAFDRAAVRLQDSQVQLRIRTRALTTTLFLRMFVADVFIHGVGGARYDTVTDEVVRRFFHVEPPAFITASATLRLPLQTFPARPEDLPRLRRTLRELRWNGDRQLDDVQRADPHVRELVRRKHELIAGSSSIDPPELRHGTFLQLRAIHAELSGLFEKRRREVLKQITRVESQLHSNRILESREHPFLLFGRGTILDFYRRALSNLTGGK